MEKIKLIKEPYDTPKMEFAEVSASDIIVTSPLELGENELNEYIGLEELW